MTKPLLAVIFALVLSCTRTPSDRAHPVDFGSEADGRTEEDLIKSHQALVWMGLQGQEPRYFEGKGMRGLGYDEYPVYALKNTLRTDSESKIINWYGTSAKLEHELEQNTTSICTYPYVWKRQDIKRILGQKSLVSLGLDFGVSQKRSILFLRKNLPRFAKHLAASGDLSIRNVLNDSTLKTVLIQGVDYGEEIATVLEQDKNGEPQIKARYLKNIELRVVKDHFQLAEMLKAGRFDYIPSDLLTKDQLNRAGLDQGELSTISYVRDRATSIYDPSFTTYSIRCSNTPLTRKLMPIMDQWIKRTRNHNWKVAIEKHRKKVDRNYQYEMVYWETPHWLFGKELASGEIDRWAEARQLDPKVDPMSTSQVLTDKSLPPVFPSKRPEAGRVLVQDKTLALLNSGDLDSVRLSSLRAGSKTSSSSGSQESYLDVDTSFGFSQVFKSTLALHLNPEELQWLRRSMARFAPVRFESLDTGNSPIRTEDLADLDTVILSPQGISPQALKGLLRKISHLRSVRFLFPERAHSDLILEFVAQHPELRQLSIVRGFFKGHDVAKALAGKKLEWLDLSGSSLEKNQLSAILKEASPTLQALILVHQATHTDEVIVPGLIQQKWPKLLHLDLRNDALSGSRATELFARLTPQLETLRLEGNFLDPTHLAQITSRQIALKVLVLCEAMLGATEPKRILFPPSLETFIAESSGLSDQDVEGWQLPKGLKVLNLVGNTFSDRGYRVLGQHLAQTPRLEELSLGRGHQNAGTHIQTLLLDPGGHPYEWLKQLRVLGLSETRLTTEDFLQVAPLLKKIDSLALADNLLTDLAGAEIANFRHLRSLDLGGNFMSGRGLSVLLRSLPQDLQSLSLDDLSDSTGILETERLPKQLKAFSFARNSLTQNAGIHLAGILPDSLIRLGLANSLLLEGSIRKLIQHIPSHLTEIELTLEASGDLMKALVESIPDSIQILRLSGTASPFTPQDFLLPRHLDLGEVIVSSKAGYVDSFYHANWEGSARFISVLGEEGVSGFCEKLQSSSLKTLGAIFKSQRASAQLLSVCSQVLPTDFYYIISAHTSHELNLHLLRTQNYGYQFYSELAPLSEGVRGKGTVKALGPSSDGASFGTLYLRGHALNDSTVRDYTSTNLRRVKWASLFDTDLGIEGLTQLLKAFHPELHHLTIQGSRLKYADVDRLLSILPKTLLVFKLQGNQIGEGGLEKVRSWVHETEKKRGYRMDFAE